MQPLLDVVGLETSFQIKAGTVKAVDGVSFSVDRGKTLGIVGESGCGKSVTSYSIMRILSHPGKVTGGKVVFDGVDLLAIPEEKMRTYRGNRIAMIFQEPMTALNPVLRVGYQIGEQILAHETVGKQEVRRRAIDLLTLVGIPSPEKRIDDYPHQLSGGMRQRAMIAMALSCSPDLLIADEPTTALDVTIQAQILDLLQGLQDKLGMSMQFITHDLGVISEIADQVIVMYAGTVVEQAASETIFTSPRHPYTVGLLESIPRMEQGVEQTSNVGDGVEVLPTIKGSVPSMLDLPQGCRFQNRCPRVQEQCKREAPVLADVAPSHSIACFNPH